MQFRYRRVPTPPGSLKTLPFSRRGSCNGLEILSTKSSCLNSAKLGLLPKEQLCPQLLPRIFLMPLSLCLCEWLQQSLLMSKESLASKYTTNTHNIYTNITAIFQLCKSQMQTSMETDSADHNELCIRTFNFFMKESQNLL